jgi:hypothetical protein
VHPTQLFTVQRTQAGENSLTLGGQENADRPTIVWVNSAIHQALTLRPVDQFNDAVVAQLQLLGEFSHAGPISLREALEREQQLVLLWSQSLAAHRLLTEAQVAPDPEAESGQSLEVLLPQGFAARPVILRSHDDIESPPISPSL